MRKSDFISKIHRIIARDGIPLRFYSLEAHETDFRGEPLSSNFPNYEFRFVVKGVISFKLKGEELSSIGVEIGEVDLSILTLTQYFFEKGFSLLEIYNNYANFIFHYNQLKFKVVKPELIGHWNDGVSQDPVGVKFFCKRFV